MSDTDRALELLASLRLDDGRRWGDSAEPFQWDDARAVLDVDGPRLHYLTRPRGASKTSDLAGVASAALVEQLPKMSRSYGFAADQDQAGLLLDAVAGFLERTDGLADVLRLEATRILNLATGASLEIMASDDASAWGLRPSLLIVDEFAAWKTTTGPRRLWRAVFSALPKVANSRLCILTTAGDPAHPSYKVLERARRSERWRVSEVEGPCPWIAEDDLAEQAEELPEWEYERLHLNHWRESEDRLTSVDDLRACVTLDGDRDPLPGRRYALSVDIGLKADRTVVSVTSVEKDADPPVVALDRMGVWQGSRRNPVSLGEVEAWILQAWSEYGKPGLVLDPWQGAQLAQRLRDRGVKVVEYSFTQQSISRLALRLHQLIKDHALALPDDDKLLEELANVRLRETSPGTYRLDHDAGRHDDRAIALALGAHHLLDTRPAQIDPDDLKAYSIMKPWDEVRTLEDWRFVRGD